MVRKTVVCLLAVLFLLSTGCMAGSGGGKMIIDNGKAIGHIVISPTATKAEVFAAEELQIYLKKITQVEVPIDKTDTLDSRPAIIVGAHSASADIIEKLKGDDHDAFAVVSDGRRLHVVGNCGTATSYAAWRWLESLGVRWLIPGAHGESIPKLSSVTLQPIEKYESPSLKYRGPSYWMPEKKGFTAEASADEHGHEAWSIATLRHRINHNRGVDKADWFTNIGPGHSYFVFLPTEKYYDCHPEWYSLKDGIRQGKGAENQKYPWHGWQLCMTNKAAAKEFAKNMLPAIKLKLDEGIPIERMRMLVAPNDGSVMCECPNCSKLVDSDGSSTSMVTYFANMVAAEIRKKYPAARIVFYAYSNHTRPGDHVKPGPGVYPELVFWTANISVGANHAHSMFSEKNDKFRRYFAEYAEVSDGLSAHEYYGHYNWFTPWPKLTQIAADIPIMAKEPKFYGMYSENHLHWGTQWPNFYLQSMLMWDASLDAEKVLDDFYKHAFGPAAPDIAAYFDILQKQMDSIPYICGLYTEIPKLLTPEVIANCNKHIRAAKKKMAAMDEDMWWRTNLVIEAWKASAKFAKAESLFVSPKDPKNDRSKILAIAAEVNEFAKTDLGRWAFQYVTFKRGFNHLTKPLDIPLDSLDAGKHEYNDSFNYGGAIKFWADLKGLQKGTWGYTAPAGKTSSIELPIKTAPGKTFKSAAIKWNISSFENGSAALIASTPGKGEITLANNIEALSKEITLPDELLDTSQITFRLVLDNPEKDALVIGLKLTVEVE